MNPADENGGIQERRDSGGLRLAFTAVTSLGCRQDIEATAKYEERFFFSLLHKDNN